MRSADMTHKTEWIAFGLYPHHLNAENAVADLRRNGFRNDQIDMVYQDAGGDEVRTGPEHRTKSAEAAAIGAGAGALGGALVGLAAWTGAIPIIGPVLAVGALGTVLINAAGGAALTGLAGALVGWGIPDEEAKYYEDEVKAGKTLVTVRADGRLGFARDILALHEGYGRTTAAEVQALNRACQTEVVG
jgi:hypothetical protein